MRVIKDKQVIEDNWQWLQEPDEASLSSAEDIIVPFKYWQANRDTLQQHRGKLALCLDGDDPVEDLADFLEQFELIAFQFPVFGDGRGYSLARVLRQRYGFGGDVRALGDVLRDQLFYMQRCGINSFQLREDRDMEDALKGLSDFTNVYQGAADEANPIPRKR